MNSPASSLKIADGSLVSYTVKREGVTKDLTATLGTMPEETYQAMVAEHMKEHVAVASN